MRCAPLAVLLCVAAAGCSRCSKPLAMHCTGAACPTLGSAETKALEWATGCLLRDAPTCQASVQSCGAFTEVGFGDGYFVYSETFDARGELVAVYQESDDGQERRYGRPTSSSCTVARDLTLEAQRDLAYDGGTLTFETPYDVAIDGAPLTRSYGSLGAMVSLGRHAVSLSRNTGAPVAALDLDIVGTSTIEVTLKALPDAGAVATVPAVGRLSVGQHFGSSRLDLTIGPEIVRVWYKPRFEKR